MDLAAARRKYSEGRCSLIAGAVHLACSQAEVKGVEEQEDAMKTEETRGQFR